MARGVWGYTLAPTYRRIWTLLLHSHYLKRYRNVHAKLASWHMSIKEESVKIYAATVYSIADLIELFAV